MIISSNYFWCPSAVAAIDEKVGDNDDPLWLIHWLFVYWYPDGQLTQSLRLKSKYG